MTHRQIQFDCIYRCLKGPCKLVFPQCLQHHFEQVLKRAETSKNKHLVQRRTIGQRRLVQRENETTWSWLVCRLGLEGFHVSGGGGLKGRGAVAEGGFWLLPASSPSPITAVGCSDWAGRLGGLDLAGAGCSGGNPLRPLHSSFDPLKGQW